MIILITIEIARESVTISNNNEYNYIFGEKKELNKYYQY